MLDCLQLQLPVANFFDKDVQIRSEIIYSFNLQKVYFSCYQSSCFTVTLCLEKCLVQVSTQERFRQVPEELFEQSGDVVRTVVLAELDLFAGVNVLPQLADPL